MNRSSVSLTHIVRAERPGRSILFITRIGFRWYSSAFCSTNVVCGIGTLEGIDQQKTAVGHLQNTLDLATKIGVTGRIDQVDLHVVPRTGHGDVLG
jgi:hypothetical protein